MVWLVRFNGGSALVADGLAANALLVTNLAASAGAMSWMVTDWVRKGKPSRWGFLLEQFAHWRR